MFRDRQFASFVVFVALASALSGADKREVSDAAITAVLREADGLDYNLWQKVKRLGVEHPDRLSRFLSNRELAEQAFGVIHYWPNKQQLDPSTTAELLKLAEDVEFEERLLAYAEYLYYIPRPQQLPEVRRLLKIGTPLELKAVIGYLNRLSNREDRRAELELPEMQAVLKQTYEGAERLIPAQHNLELVTWVAREPFRSHPQYRNHVTQLLLKHLDRFTDGKTKTDEAFGDRIVFLIRDSKADRNVIQDGLIDFFLRQNDAVAQSALKATYVVAEVREFENSPLLKDILDELPRRQPRFAAFVEVARNKK